jgi:two-component system, chemotaxis family, chemotaxis protein CheY
MKKTVLVVDDSATVRGMVRAALGAEYEIVEAADGVEGLDCVRGGGLSMVICDVNMPRMDGLEMLHRLKLAGSTVPVVMLTTEGQTALIARAREEGARGWIVKPFNADMLRQAVARIAVAA